MKLSEQRAIAVREYLINKGVPASMLTTQGFGPNKPTSTNATLEGRRRNRRVEFVISYEETTRTEVNDRVE
jgi:OOP family OmpA-OmpF porin